MMTRFRRPKAPRPRYGFEYLDVPMTMLTEGRPRPAWRVDEPIIYHSRDARRFVVPSGFVSDLTTAFPEGRWSLASILHDWLYRLEHVTRAEADRYYLEAMQSLGVPWRRRWLIYAGVRCGGWLVWGQYH